MDADSLFLYMSDDDVEWSYQKEKEKGREVVSFSDRGRRRLLRKGKIEKTRE